LNAAALIEHRRASSGGTHLPGAIVRRGRLATGVTTVATLWLVTVIGLIIDGGYIEPAFADRRGRVVRVRTRRTQIAARPSRAAGIDDKRNFAFGGRCADAPAMDERGKANRRRRPFWRNCTPAGVERLNWRPIDAELLAE